MTRPAGFDHFYTSSYGINWYRRVNSDGTVDYAQAEDVQSVLEQNKKMFTHNDGWSKDEKWMRRRARIPFALINKWAIEDGVNVFTPEGQEYVKKKLRDPDYRHLLTADYHH